MALAVAGPFRWSGALAVPRLDTRVSPVGRQATGCSGDAVSTRFRLGFTTVPVVTSIVVSHFSPGCAAATAAVTLTGHDGRPVASGSAPVADPAAELVVVLDHPVDAAAVGAVHIAVGTL
jgi:hypothetical protein